ncbi:ABC transporter ATP-binding protein/permease [Patescibacteria group bacterium]|nr:ABC transporter ATP-binding protein/permease [Patescibacteria group bacterium]
MKKFIKFIFRQLKPFKGMVTFCGAVAVLAALLDMAAPIIMGYGFDLAKADKAVYIYGGALLVWFAVRFVADRMRNYIAAKGFYIASMVSENYDTAALGKLLNKPLSFHYGKKSPETFNKLSNFRWNLIGAIEGAVFDFIPALLATVAILGYLFFIDWRIGCVLTFGVAAFLFYTIKSSRGWQRVRDKYAHSGRDIDQFGWDGLRNVLVVKSTSNEKYFNNRLKKLKDRHEAAVKRFSKVDKRQGNFQNAILATASFATLMLGVINFTNDVFTFGRLSAVVAYIFLIFGYVRFVQWQFRVFLKTKVDYDIVEKALNLPAENLESGKDVELKGEVQFSHISFAYQKGRKILKDVDFSAREGERVAIIGESGEGKTTIVDLLGGYYKPTKGDILFGGIKSEKINLISLRSQMAYVPQDLTLFHDTIEANIRYGRPSAKKEEVEKAARQAHLLEFIEKLPKKWKTVVGERGLKLSGGERQRAALARAFLRNPKILILDEPTAHLDSATEKLIHQSLDELMKGKTTFIIAHRLRTVEQADKILVLKNGYIVESGKHGELLKNSDGEYAKLLRYQSVLR